jgi:hypothetical protein
MEQTSGFLGEWAAQLARARSGGVREQDAFFARLTAAALLAPRSPGRQQGLAILQHPDGGVYLPCFTSQNEYRNWRRPEDVPVLLSFSVLHGMITDSAELAGMVVNPFGKQLVLTRETLGAIEINLTGMTRARVEHRGQTAFWTANYSAALARDYADALANSPLPVFEGYILAAAGEGETEPHLLFLIDFDGDRKLLFPAIAQVIKPHMRPGSRFELRKADSALLAGAARVKAQAVYKRKRQIH